MLPDDAIHPPLQPPRILAVCLSWVAGYTNVIVLSVCGTAVSHVTGTATMLAKGLAGQSAPAMMWFGGLWLCFLCGAASSALIIGSARRHRRGPSAARALAAEAALLACVAVGIGRLQLAAAAPRAGMLVAFVAAFTMGLQNAVVTQLAGGAIRTTHLTGVTTDLGIEGVRYLSWLFRRLGNRRHGGLWRAVRASGRRGEFQRAVLLASIIGSFMLGAASGTWAQIVMPAMALLVPTALLLGLVHLERRRHGGRAVNGCRGAFGLASDAAPTQSIPAPAPLDRAA